MKAELDLRANGPSGVKLGPRANEIDASVSPNEVEPGLVSDAKSESDVKVRESSASNLSSTTQFHAKLTSDISKTQALGSAKWGIQSFWKALSVSDRTRFDQLRPEQFKAKFVELANGFPISAEKKLPEALLGLLRSNKLLCCDLKGGNLMDTLVKLSTQELADGLDRGTVLTELIERILTPEKISQRNRGTCTVTSLEYLLASKQPAEFARLVTGLVSKEGTVTMASGRKLERDGLEADDSKRANIDRIFQSSMMEEFNGNFTEYDNKTDKHKRFDWFDAGSGLTKDEFDDAIDAALGKNYQASSYSDSSSSRKSLTERLKKSLGAGNPVAIGMYWDPDKNAKHSSHKLVLTGISDTHVELWNPWGDGERGGSQSGPPRELNKDRGAGHIRMTHDDFFSRLRNTHLPPGF